MTEPTDPTTADAAAEHVQAFLDAWDATDYLTEMTELAGPFDGIPALTTFDLRALLADRRELTSLLEQALIDLRHARDDRSDVWLAERLEVLRDATLEAVGLLHRLASGALCSFDDDGACWVHDGYWPPCPHPLGRRFVETWAPAVADGVANDPEGRASAARDATERGVAPEGSVS